MDIRFTINYRTNNDQRLEVNCLKNNSFWQMSPKDNGDWFLDKEFDTNSTQSILYKYVVRDLKTNTLLEEYSSRTFDFPTCKPEFVKIRDFWRPKVSDNNVLDSSAFKNSIFRREHSQNNCLKKINNQKVNVKFSIPVIRIEKNHYVGVKIIGIMPEYNQIFMLNDQNYPNWQGEFSIEKPKQYIEYKYCIIDKNTNKVILEEYVTRFFKLDELEKNLNEAFYVLNDEDFKYPRYPFKGAGVAIPVFSLRSKDGLGIGEFLDLIPLIDWAKKVDLKLIQLLPINDTTLTHTYTDSYPYCAVSVYALHPIYLRVQEMGKLSSSVSEEALKEMQSELNRLPKIDYEAVEKAKIRFFKQIYNENNLKFLEEKEYQVFFNKNKEWLKPYAVFCYFRELYHTPDFSKWGNFGEYTKELVDKMCQEDSPEFKDVAIFFFLQYHLHLQLKRVSDYARENGVVIKGDIPIGISRYSVDAWTNPDLYNLDCGAGAPPDDFSDDGQNWGFPTYNWDLMAKDGFAWWKNRLKNMAEYFDAYRIDHILGFFRIWEVPINQTKGITGVFNPAIAISKLEFVNKGVNFDYNRFCKPYIRDYILRRLFGDLAGLVKHSYLEEYEKGCYNLKEEVKDQVSIEKYFSSLAIALPGDLVKFQQIKAGLLYLVSEVLFFEDKKEKNTFHPRHSMFKTNSFKDLDEIQRSRVADIYNDYFYVRNEELWKKQAMIKLPAIVGATEMMVCGEDLGMIPACVPEVMSELNILSLEVQRMPKIRYEEFAKPSTFPYLSVASPSSHDTSTLRGWWEEDHARNQRFYETILRKVGNAPYFCETWIVKDIIAQHFYSPSMWAIFPIQDYLSLSEKLRSDNPQEDRINVPAEVNHYWRYRCHIDLETLLNDNELNNQIKEMIRLSGRNNAY